MFLASAPLYSQISEIGVMAGVTYYKGDLNKKHFKNSNLAYGFLYRYSFDSRVTLRFNVLLGHVNASDDQSDNPNQINRNLSFRSDITELSGMVEINYYSFDAGNKQTKFTTYLMTGITYFKMNPEARYLDVWYELQALSTEGQGLQGAPERYNLDNWALPFGLGAKVNLGGRFVLSAEYSIRLTATDYLDDVSGLYYDNEAIRQQVGVVASELADRRLNKSDVPTGIDGNGQVQHGNVLGQLSVDVMLTVDHALWFLGLQYISFLVVFEGATQLDVLLPLFGQLFFQPCHFCFQLLVCFSSH